MLERKWYFQRQLTDVEETRAMSEADSLYWFVLWGPIFILPGCFD